MYTKLELFRVYTYPWRFYANNSGSSNVHVDTVWRVIFGGITFREKQKAIFLWFLFRDWHAHQYPLVLNCVHVQSSCH